MTTEPTPIPGPAPRAFVFGVDGTLVSHRTKRGAPSRVDALREL